MHLGGESERCLNEGNRGAVGVSLAGSAVWQLKELMWFFAVYEILAEAALSLNGRSERQTERFYSCYEHTLRFGKYHGRFTLSLLKGSLFLCNQKCVPGERTSPALKHK